MRKLLLIAGVLVPVLAAAPARAVGQTTRPLLAQLDAEIRSLYADVAAGTVRVHLPMPTLARLMGPDAHPLAKWSDVVDAGIWRRMQELAATRPVDRRAAAMAEGSDAGAAGDPRTVIYLDEMAEQMIAVLPRGAGERGEFIGVMLEDAEHVAIPAHIEKEELGGRPLRVTAGQEQIEATFVGSDRQTNVTVIKLAKRFGKPMPVADAKPPAGALVLMLSPARRGAVLKVWTGGQEDHAVIVDMSCRLAGFARPGQLLAGQDLRFVAHEIIKHGKVKRAQLGVLIQQVAPTDPVRQQQPLVGARPALRVAKVLPDSAAAAAGLKPGDLILSLAGQDVEDLPTFAAAISSHSGPTELKLVRDGAEVAVTVNLQPK